MHMHATMYTHTVSRRGSACLRSRASIVFTQAVHASMMHTCMHSVSSCMSHYIRGRNQKPHSCSLHMYCSKDTGPDDADNGAIQETFRVRDTTLNIPSSLSSKSTQATGMQEKQLRIQRISISEVSTIPQILEIQKNTETYSWK